MTHNFKLFNRRQPHLAQHPLPNGRGGVTRARHVLRLRQPLPPPLEVERLGFKIRTRRRELRILGGGVKVNLRWRGYKLGLKRLATDCDCVAGGDSSLRGVGVRVQEINANRNYGF
jgi:hypothetical protein